MRDGLLWNSLRGRADIFTSAFYRFEPPNADPHVRWCGRGELGSPYPIEIIKDVNADKSDSFYVDKD